MRRFTLLFALLFTVPLFAQYAMTPDRGPVTGGTEVIFKGTFNFPSYGVLFGSVWGETTKVDNTTLRVITPQHLPGPVAITLFESDVFNGTNLTFTFEGEAEESFEPVLLPVFTQPIQGAHGSEFRTDFRARLVKDSMAEIYGLECTGGQCEQREGGPWLLRNEYVKEVTPQSAVPTGTPGAFLYMAKEQFGRVAMNLRAYDTSRDAENFGTEIPVVRLRDFATGTNTIDLLGIPSDPRFRNTLRIYGYGDTPTTLSIDMLPETELNSHQLVVLPAQTDPYHPSYVEITNFPVNQGMVRVTIHAPVLPDSPNPMPRWAFVSVTNNETQHITLVTPQP